MSRKIAVASLAAGLAMLALGRPAVLDGQSRTRVYVSVADDKGRPVTGLTATDFKIAIDDREQEVLSAAPATEPLDLVLLTDRLGLDPAYSNFTVQHALSGFVKTIRGVPDSRIALTTFDGPVVRITGFNTPPQELNRALGRLTTTAVESGLLNAVVDACELLRDSKTDRKVIFAMFAAYRADTSNQWNDKSIMTLWQSNASLWALEVQSPGGAVGGNAAREEVVAVGSRMSGGMHVNVGSSYGLANQAELMAGLIARQYVIHYAPGTDPNTSSRRRIAVNRNGVKILFPTWVSR